jgi:hypothetical protein
VTDAVRRRVLLATSALAVPVAGCVAPVSLDAPAVAEQPAPVPDWIPVRLGEADHGRLVTLAPGESVAVALRAPSASGAGWIVRDAPASLVQTGRYSRPVWPAGAPASVTGPGPVWQVFVFEAGAPAAERRLAFELRGDVPGVDRPPVAVYRIVVAPR